MKIQPFGENALLVTFEKAISQDVNQKVISLYGALKKTEGISYLIPAYNSLTIGIVKEQVTLAEATLSVRAIVEKLSTSVTPHEESVSIIPVCYEKPYDLDSDEVCEQAGITKEELITLHTSTTFHVYMLGFVAGFAYMGSLPSSLECKRKATPRLRVPKGSVGLAGLQTGIYPTEAPGGWQIIGQTPVEMFNPNLAQTSLLRPGQKVRFRAISIEEFKIIRLKIDTGIFEMEEINA